MADCEILVIGGGPAGMAAVLGAWEAGCRKILLVERSEQLGGILRQCLHSGFGLATFGEELTGPEYARRYIQRLQGLPVDILTDTSVIELKPDGTALLSGAVSGLTNIKAAAVILASGCRERPIGTLPVTGTRPSGIFTAGAAQKMVNLGGYDFGQRFVILGSGDVGMIMARQLALLGKTIIAVLEKEARCGGLERNRINCLERFNIPLRTLCTVTRVHGSARVEGVTVRNLSDGHEEYIACDTLITSVGLIPERELAEQAGGGGALPDWLYLCGNACYVHDLVDDVTYEGEAIGRAAADFVRTGRKKAAPAIMNGTRTAVNGKAGKTICIACPKGCPLVKTDTGWSGALCGRKDPVPSE
ncbi:MAG: FAD-dependent oxidoreductase [Clostridiales bacterium]|jgi:thioredoxin reductase|nr:FAD-dependent oxidoreductase [Clostridiales bacterium]